MPAERTSLLSVLSREMLSPLDRLEPSIMGTAAPELLLPGFSHGRDDKAACNLLCGLLAAAAEPRQAANQNSRCTEGVQQEEGH